MTGQFITLEGIEGVGKSTHLKFVASWLREQGHSVVVTREPGGTPIAEQIRSVILEGSTDKLPPLAELLLMFAARAEHLETLIKPALSAVNGSFVIDSSMQAMPIRGREEAYRWKSLKNWKPPFYKVCDRI